MLRGDTPCISNCVLLVMASRNWYRFKACFYFIIFLLTTPFYCILTAVLWTSFHILHALNIYTKQEAPTLLPRDLRKTVLFTDSVNTKTLNVIRCLGKVGHRIIVVDSNRYKHTGASWSRYVAKVIYVAHHAGPTTEKYIEEVVKIALQEQVDWFIPISKTQNAIINYMVEQRLAKLRPSIRSLGFGDLELARLLNHKLDFLDHCKKIGLSVPDFHAIYGIEDLQKLREINLFNEKHYFLKPIDDFSEDRLCFKRIPGDEGSFNKYLKEYEPKVSSKPNYFVCEYIKGTEFTSNVVCRQGKVLSLETLPTCSSQTEFDNVPNQAVRNWTFEFCSKMKISGGICFDFLQDDVTGKVYCIECNPRLHSSISLHHGNPELAKVFQAALEPESLQDETISFPVEPSSTSPRAYWLYLEFHKLFSGRQGVGGLLWSLMNGRDAVFDKDDPMPFLVSNTISAMIQLKRAILSGARFGIYNPVIGRLSR